MHAAWKSVEPSRRIVQGSKRAYACMHTRTQHTYAHRSDAVNKGDLLELALTDGQADLPTVVALEKDVLWRLPRLALA
jgi:hypothetical protein